MSFASTPEQPERNMIGTHVQGPGAGSGLGERRQRILNSIRDSGSASVVGLAQALGVSESTVRRDLEWLAKRDLLERTWGGGVPVDAFQSAAGADLVLDARQRQNREAKHAIARLAADQIRDGDVVIIDAGSTMLQVAPFLAGKSRLTVITTSLPLAWELRGRADIEVIVSGGHLRPQASSLHGMFAEQALAQVYADVALIGARGITLDEGLTNPVLEEIPAKRLMIKAARRSIALVDASKWGLVFMGVIAPVTDVAAIITDDGVPVDSRRRVEDAGVQVLVASK